MNAGISGLFLLALLLSLEVALLYAGRRRRIGDEPHCRRCNYLLRGLQSERCPECGAVLSPAAIVHGERRRRWGAFAAGWLILALVGAMLVASSADSVRNIDWYEYTPMYFVLRDLNSAQPASVQRAWTELLRRDAAGHLSAQTRDRLVVFALAQQAAVKPPYGPMDTAAVNYLGTRLLAGDLPAAQRTKAFEQAVRLTLQFRPKVIAGDLVPYLFAHDGAGPENNSIWIRITEAGATIDGKSVRGNDGGSAGFSGFSSGSFGGALKCPAVGKHSATLTCRVEIFDGSFDSTTAALLYRVDRTLSGNFEVLATEPNGYMQPLFDPKLVAAMAAAIKPLLFRYNVKQKSLDGQFNISGLPVNLACDVFLRFGGNETKFSAMACRANSPCQYGVGGPVKGPVPATIDIILRPSEKAARQTVDFQSYWNQEIVFPNIPVSQK
jgi:hypothetical protein